VRSPGSAGLALPFTDFAALSVTQKYSFLKRIGNKSASTRSNVLSTKIIIKNLQHLHFSALYFLKRRKANWIGHILRRNRLLKYFIRGKLEEMRRGRRRRKQLLDD